MKITSDKWQVASDTNRQPVRRESVFSCHPPPVTCHGQRGVALVITLILLSATLVMALAFLAISGRERGSVTTQTDTATTRLAADAGLAAAEAQIAANILSTTNPYSFGLLVSTNYINYNGFQTGVANPTNVNYDYRSDNQAFTLNDRLQNLENLFVSPRPPVFIPNPTNPAAPLDFRYYLDLNRNGRYDTNGVVGNFDNNNNLLGTSFQVGDPEWIGVLEHPDQPYGPNNKFIARFAFIALPVGNSLDLNAIHNQALKRALDPLSDGYFRNQGVGTWEINLAAFLADLNTNQWNNSAFGNYRYNQASLFPFANSGAAFNDAFSLLTNRYAGNYNTLASVNDLYGGPPFGAGYKAFISDNIDGYSMGPLQITFRTNAYLFSANPSLPWAGADNTNHSFTPGDLFDPAKSSGGFTGRLLNAGSGVSTYDRYTFYRMLSQLGTDTTPESGKMNLNYDNLDPWFNGLPNVNGTASVTNFVAWQPLAFFTNAADRLLKAYTTQWAVSYYTNNAGTLLATNPNPSFVATFNVTNAFGVTDIPVWVSNRFVYTPAVHRQLQLAANIYDATTNSLGVNGNRYDYPSVFRPLFSKDQNGFGTNIFITGYTNVSLFGGPGDVQFNLPIDLAFLAQTNGQVVNLLVNVYGVPWIVGAKKGFPNFNELAMDCAFQITRKVEVTRPSPTTSYLNYSYYQMFILNITNQVGVECWNSYTNAYTNSVMIYVYDSLKNVVLTNDEGFIINLSTNLANSYPVATWPGFTPTSQNGPSFQIPLDTAVMTISNSIYRFNQPSTPFLTPDLNEIYETNVIGYPQPHWGLMVTNDLRVLMVDTTVVPNRIIDYVELSGPDSARDLTSEIISQSGNDLWATNWNNNLKIPQGLANQVDVSLGLSSPDVANGGPWPVSTPQDIAQQQENEIDGFRAYFKIGPLYQGNPGESEAVAEAGMTNAMQAPFTPTFTVVQHVSWQANDPLVHFLANDLNWANAIRTDRNVTSLTDSSDGDNLGILNSRYAPWGILMSVGTDQVDQNTVNLAYKDPLVKSSDNWDFPSYKFPTAGWLGRVHRGTPWQTVYLKSTNILAWVQNNTGPITWRDWTGNYNPFDAANAGPAQDRLLFDLFTTAVNDNATRGTLSVNQSADRYDPVSNPTAGLAAWSALFSGVVVPNPTNAASYAIINPAGPNASVLNPPLWQIVTNINGTRAIFTNADGLVGVFEHKGDILSVPQLSNPSLFFNGLDPNSQINDEMYEWLPQQVMSLLRAPVSPRYVIYSYGQALKPAPNGIYLGATPAGMFGLVTNYQVVSEITTRAVVRLETLRTNANGAITVTPPRAVIESFNILPPD